MDKMSVCLAIAGLTIIGVVCMGLQADSGNRKAFMRECQDYGMPHYQCVAMWRGGTSLLIIPAPAPVYHGPWDRDLPVDPN